MISPLPLSVLREECGRTVRLLSVLDAMADKHNTTAELIWSHCAEDPVREARAEAWAILHREGWTQAFLARVFCRDKRTVNEALQRRQGNKRERRAA